MAPAASAGPEWPREISRRAPTGSSTGIPSGRFPPSGGPESQVRRSQGKSGRTGRRATSAARSATSSGCQAAGAGSSRRSLRRISGPMPAGSPWVRARTGRAGGEGSGPVTVLVAAAVGPLAPPLQLLLLEHVTDEVLLDEEVRPLMPVELEGALVVPLDPAPQLLAIGEDDHHGRLRGHLLEVVELLGVGLLGRRLLAAHAARGEVLLELVHVRPYQFAVRHFGFHGRDEILKPLPSSSP